MQRRKPVIDKLEQFTGSGRQSPLDDIIRESLDFAARPP